MRIIITGGTGLVGRHLAASLAKDGHEVIVLSRSPEKYRGKLPNGVRAEGWDAKTADSWGHLADGAGAVVNLAGENLAEGRWTEARKRRILDSRVNAGQAVVQAVENAAQKPGVVIQASGVNYYGLHGDEIITEQSEPGNDFLSQVCIEWENSSKKVEEAGVRRAITRSGVVFSMEGGALPRMLLPFRLFVGGPIGNGRQWFSWVHLADEVAAIRFLIENQNASGAFNLVAPNPLTNKQFARTLGRVMNRPALLPVPAFALKLLFGEMSTVLLDGQRVIPKRLEEAGFKFTFPEAEGALKDVLKS